MDKNNIIFYVMFKKYPMATLAWMVGKKKKKEKRNKIKSLLSFFFLSSFLVQNNKQDTIDTLAFNFILL